MVHPKTGGWKSQEAESRVTIREKIISTSKRDVNRVEIEIG